MAKIPNQNNINDTIKARIESLNDIVDVVIKAASSKVIQDGSKHIGNLKLYQTVVQTVFGKDGVGTIMLTTANSLEPFAKIKMPKFSILKKNMLRVIDFSSYVATIQIDVAKMMAVKDKLKPIVDVYTEIGNVFGQISKLGAPKMLGVKLLFIKWNLWRIMKLSFFLTGLNLMTPLMLTAMISLKWLSLLTGSLSKVFMDIESIKIGVSTYIKLKLIPGVLRRTLGIIQSISLISSYIRMMGGVKDALILSAVFNMLESVFTSIKGIKVGMFMNIKLNRICRSLRLLNKITRLISRVRVNAKVFTRLAMLQLMFGSLGLVFISVVLLTPAVILAIPAMLILIGGMYLLKLTVNVLVKILARMAGAQAIKGLLYIIVIGGLFTLLAAMFLIIALIAMPVVKATLWIIGLIGVIILVTAAVIGVGALMTLLAPVIPYVLPGLLIMIVLIGILTIMAVMLKVIQAINLDPALVKENIKVVLDTARMVIDVIFGSDDDTNPQESDKGWIASIVEFIGGQLATVIKAILAVAFLAVMVVAILLILLIACELRLIQELNLDTNLIKKNVRVVIDTAMLVVSTIFDGGDKKSKETDKSWIASVIEFIGGTIATVIKAILAVAFLALMVVAILFILLIAGQLRLLQELNLDVAKIQSNVGIVIDTAVMVATSLFDRPDRDGQPSNKGFLSAVISFICPELGMILDALMSIAFLALSILSISLILVLAAQLRLLQDIPLDPALISANVSTVIETCQYVVDAIMGRSDRPDDPSSKSWIRKLFEWCGMGGLLQIIDCIMALAWLGMSVALINMVTMLANQLKTLQDIKLDKGRITKNTEAVCKTADAVSQCVLGRKNPIKGSSDGPLGKVLRWLFPALAEAIDMMTKMKWVSGIMSTVGVVKQVADVLMTLLKMPDVTPVKAKVKYVCDTADEIVKMVTSRPSVDTWDDAKSRMTWMERINKAVKEMSRISPTALNKSKKALAGHIALVKKIGEVDVVKLETSAKMFQQMATFSKSIQGNFKALAESINEDLMPVLEELKKIMETIPEKLEVGFQNTSASIAATTEEPTADGLTAQVGRENPTLDAAEVDKIVKSRLSAYGKKQSNGVVSKIDELISLLKGNGGTVEVRTI